MRYPGYTDFEGRIFWAAGNIGPTALPGQYTVRLTVDGQTQERDFEIKLDPRLEGVTIAQLQERFQLALRIRDGGLAQGGGSWRGARLRPARR